MAVSAISVWPKCASAAVHAAMYPVRLAERIRSSALSHITKASTNIISMARSGAKSGIDSAFGIIKN